LYLRKKFEPNHSVVVEVMAIFPKSKMAGVLYFGIVMTPLKTTHVEYLVISWTC